MAVMVEPGPLCKHRGIVTANISLTHVIGQVEGGRRLVRLVPGGG